MRQKAAGEISIRLLFIVLGGAMQGPYGAGQISALQEMGYTDRFLTKEDSFLGISTGAPTCAFAMAGNKQALLGTSYFYTVCTTPSFIDYFRVHQIIDVGFVERILRDGPMQLDVDAVKKNPAHFYVQAYNKNKQKPEFREVTVNQSIYTDGAFDDPLPITRAMKQFKPTHALNLPNIPFNHIPSSAPSKAKKIFFEMIPKEGSLGFIRNVLEHRQKLRCSLDDIAQYHNVKIGVAWPPEMGLHPSIQDRGKIKDAIKASAKEMFALFGESERSLELYEEKYDRSAAAGFS